MKILEDAISNILSMFDVFDDKGYIVYGIIGLIIGTVWFLLR